MGVSCAYGTVPSRVLTGLGAAVLPQTPHGFWSVGREFSLTRVHRLLFVLFSSLWHNGSKGFCGLKITSF